MKRVLLILFFLPTISFAQILVGVNAGAIWNSYVFNKSVGSYEPKGQLNWEFGLNGRYQVNEKLAVDVKANIASKNFSSVINYDHYLWINTSDPTFGFSGKRKYSITQTFVEIPISVSYFLSGTKKKFNTYFSLGLSCAKKISGNSSNINGWGLTYSDYTHDKYKDFLISAKPAFGAVLDLGKNFAFFSELCSNIYLQEVGLTGNPFQLGLNFSILKKLGAKKASAN
jgi:hypothetical protein